MSIPEKRDTGTKTKSEFVTYSEGYLVPETEIRKFIEKLPVNQINVMAGRMQVVSDVTGSPIGGELNESDLQLIEKVAKESSNKRYQSIMGSILTALRQGPAGIIAANQTARRAVEIAFSWTYKYLFAFNQYKASLREIRRKE